MLESVFSNSLPTSINREIRSVLLKDSLIFGVGTILVVIAFVLGRLIHTWAHGLCSCTPGLLVEYGPSTAMVFGAASATLWSLSTRSRERLVAKNKLEAANRQIRKDLEAAAAIQRSFLPESPPDVKGMQFGWHYQPCEELAGDTFNLFRLNNDTLGIYSLDVSGHGVTSALLSVTLNRVLRPIERESSIVRRHSEGGDYKSVSPERVVKLLNHQFMMNLDEPQYFTLFYGVLDLDTRLLYFVSAGHPPPIHLPLKGESKALEVAGFPVGMFEDASWEMQSLQLEPGDRLYLYSDGITEAEDSREEPFGQSRLQEILDQGRDCTLSESVDLVMAEVRRFSSFPIQDDISIVAAEIES